MSDTPNRPSFPNSSSPAPNETKLSRRRFGQRAAAAAGSLSVVGLLTGLDSTRVASQAATDSQAAPSQQSPEVEAKLANIIRKYGDRLSAEQHEHLRRILAYNEKMLTSIRSFPVQNGDSPASVLKVSFSDESSAPKRELR